MLKSNLEGKTKMSEFNPSTSGSIDPSIYGLPSLPPVTGKFDFDENQIVPLEHTYQDIVIKYPEAAEVVGEILTRGTAGDMPIGLPDVIGDAYGEMEERIAFANLTVEDPETAKIVRDIAGFHATNSGALGCMLELSEGSLVAAYARDQKGLPAVSGAGDTKVTGKSQSTISFGTLSGLKGNVGRYGGPIEDLTHEEVVRNFEANIESGHKFVDDFGPQFIPMVNQDQAALADYRGNPDSLRATLQRHRFPVAIGVKSDFVRAVEEDRDNGRLIKGASGMTEFQPFTQEVPIDQMVLAVPRNCILFIKQSLKALGYQQHVDIVPLESLIEASSYANQNSTSV